MGDRTYYAVECREQDRERFERIGFSDGEYDSEIPGFVALCDSEGSAYCDLQELAKDGIPFFGYHDGGYEYDACDFVSFRRRWYEVQGSQNGQVVRIGEDGKVNADDLKAARAYFRTKQKLIAIAKTGVWLKKQEDLVHVAAQVGVKEGE